MIKAASPLMVVLSHMESGIRGKTRIGHQLFDIERFSGISMKIM
jgi:hypothetical protein